MHLTGLKEHLTQEEEVKYLGCQMEGTGDPGQEVMKRISKTMITLKTLDQFWLNSNCPIKRKLEVYDAVIKAKFVVWTRVSADEKHSLKKVGHFSTQRA